MRAEYEEVYGARKTWLELNRRGIPVARCTVERVMREHGLRGVRRGRAIRTTIPGKGPGHERAADLIGRDFTAPAPDRRWVADFTHVATLAGTVYVAFVVDIFSRMFTGWAAARHKRAKLVLDALDMALWHRDHGGHRVGAGLIHHSDAGSQYTSIAFTAHLAAEGIVPSIGSVGDALDNALMESGYRAVQDRADRPARAVAGPGPRGDGDRWLPALVQQPQDPLRDRGRDPG